MNGACLIHDFEMAWGGRTSEDVGPGLDRGLFGMARETGEFLNRATCEGVAAGLGLGRAIGDAIGAEVPETEPLVAMCIFRHSGARVKAVRIPAPRTGSPASDEPGHCHTLIVRSALLPPTMTRAAPGRSKPAARSAARNSRTSDLSSAAAAGSGLTGGRSVPSRMIRLPRVV